jgi:predicted nucleic acid-binding protein
MRGDAFLLDACAILAFLTDEAGAGEVERLLREADNGTARVFAHRINILEVYYNTLRGEGALKADAALRTIAGIPIVQVDTLTEPVLCEAGRLKAAFRVSLADAVALAQAHALHAALVTADHHEMDPVDQAGEVRFLWIR